jgi:hypothetical protein
MLSGLQLSLSACRGYESRMPGFIEAWDRSNTQPSPFATARQARAFTRPKIRAGPSLTGEGGDDGGCCHRGCSECCMADEIEVTTASTSTTGLLHALDVISARNRRGNGWHQRERQTGASP